jgi:hypothetical protein
MSDHPHLTLIDPEKPNQHNEEFIPLPYFPWDERPPTLPLDHDEAATAIHLAQGDLPRAAALLKVPLIRLDRSLRSSPRLQRVLADHHALALHRASAEVLRALDASDDRRREWGAARILSSRMAQGHPFSPAPPSSSTTTSASLTVGGPSRTLTFRWRTDADDAATPDPLTPETAIIDGSSD